MSTGQISATDYEGAKSRAKKFIGLAKQYLASEKGLVFRQATYSVWVVEVYYVHQLAIGKIDLQLPLELQFYQLGQQIDKLKGKYQMDSNGTALNTNPEEGAEKTATELTCRICGCTYHDACKGGRGWTLIHRGKAVLCTKCITEAVPECIDLLVLRLFC